MLFPIRSSNSCAKEIQSASSVQETKASFPQFNRLPLDVRLLIWEATIEPRIVHLKLCELVECKHILRRVHSDIEVPCTFGKPITARQSQGCLCSQPYDSDLEDIDEDIEYERHRLDSLRGFKSDCQIPSLLLTCRESFSVGSKAYTRSFSSLGSFPQTYFNFELDTLYLDWLSYPDCGLLLDGLLSSYLCSDELAKIKRLAVDDDILLHSPESHESFLCDILAVFGNVEKFTIVTEHHRNERFEQGMSEEQRSAQSIFLEPVDIRRRCYMFEHPEYHINHDHKQCSIFARPDDRLHLLPRRVDFIKTICEEEFDQTRDSRIKRDLKVFSRPALFYRVLSTSTMKSKLEALQQAYEAAHSCRCYESESPFCDLEED